MGVGKLAGYRIGVTRDGRQMVREQWPLHYPYGRETANRCSQEERVFHREVGKGGGRFRHDLSKQKRLRIGTFLAQEDQIKMINIFQPTLGKEELDAVGKVFESGWVGKGPLTTEFERSFADHLSTQPAHVKSLSCCTEGLFQSLELLNIGVGDEVILPTISFTGAGNAVAASGAKPIFCDVDPETLNATAETIAPLIGPKTRAVMILHFGGVPCEMDEIVEALSGREIALIEDSACSVASLYKGRSCGTLGDIGAWSFDAMKILVTGDGGMLYCKCPELATKAENALYLGLTTQSGIASTSGQRWWEYQVSSFGRRAVMNDIAAAIGLEQLKKLPSFIERRRHVHKVYDETFLNEDWLKTPPRIPDHSESSYYFYWIQTSPAHRDQLALFLRERGIYTTFRYYPLHWVELYDDHVSLPHAERAALETLCLPIHQALSDSDIEKVVTGIIDFGKTL